MKSSIISVILLLLLGGCISKKKQVTLSKSKDSIQKSDSSTYRPLKLFKGDTLAFVQESILNRKDYYIGKELRVFLTDLSIPIKVYTYGKNPNNIYVSNYLSLLVNNYFQQNAKLAKGEDPIDLVIVWKNPINYEELEKISKENKGFPLAFSIC